MPPPDDQALADFLAQHFAAMDRRLDALRRDLAELRADMLGHFDAFYRRLERLEQEYGRLARASGASKRAGTNAVAARSWGAIWRRS